MLSLPIPAFSVVDVIDACEPTLTHVAPARAAFALAEEALSDSIRQTKVWNFPALTAGIDEDTANEADWAYPNRLRSKSSAARDFYNTLRLSAPDGTCTVCGVRDAAALDHYLPRKHYPALAIQPINLVPICTKCNDTKKTRCATSSTDQFLHPYFDDFGTQEWLVASVVENHPTGLEFEINRSTDWGDVFYTRVAKHFERFELKELYAKKSGGLLANHRGAFQSFLEDGGPELVKKEIELLADSHAAAGLSPWRTAAFRAWSRSEWFQSGGWIIPEDIALERQRQRRKPESEHQSRGESSVDNDL